MWNLVKIGQAVPEKMTLNGYVILYMYVASEQGHVAPGNKILIVTKGFCYFDHTQ